MVFRNRGAVTVQGTDTTKSKTPYIVTKGERMTEDGRPKWWERQSIL